MGFSINNFGQVRKIRFDPIEGERCSVVVHQIKCRYLSGKEEILAKEKLRSNTADFDKNGNFNFNVKDPQIYLPVSGEVHKIIIDFTIKLKDKEHEKYSIQKFKQEKTSLVLAHEYYHSKDYKNALKYYRKAEHEVPILRESIIYFINKLEKKLI